MRRFRLRHLSLAAAALCTAISPMLVGAQVQPGALPTGWNVTSGNAAISRNGNTLNINQTTPQALVNFQSFNVGSGALVDIRQPGAQAALLARTTGGEASQILGQIKANGALWLINPAGIMVGAGARIDVGSFVASTLNVSDSDFLAGRLHFKSGAAPAGNVHNAGTISAASGGSIYLVAPNVTNAGLLNAPNGEVLLAAGQNVQLMDTGTPGVSVAISGAAGEATNLGRIVAEAGRIGLAAGLVNNGGEIRADSVVREGGRVFLRASGDLKTTASSNISASGTSGGRVELIADGAARIDGGVAATGSAGKGGYVDTSGHRSLDVVNVPVVGHGGEWHIDPYEIEVVAEGPDMGVGIEGSAIVSNESGARIGAGTITAQLDAGVNVSITTGTGNPATDPWLGDITVSAAIAKTGALDSTLTLNASNNIYINAPITSANSALGLNLNSNYLGNYPEANHAVQLNASLDLQGGVLNVSEGLGGSGNGMLQIGSGTTWLNAPSSAINAAEVFVGDGATLALNRAGSAISGRVVNNGTVSVGGTGTAVLDHGGAHWGHFEVAEGAGLSFAGAHGFNAGSTFAGTGTVEWSGDVALGTTLLFGPGGNSLVLHDAYLYGNNGGSLSTQGAGVVVDGVVTLRGNGAWTNGASVSVQGNGSITAFDENTRFQNDGVVTTSGTQADVLRGAGGVVPTFINNGSLVKTSAVDQQYTGFASTAGSVVRAEAGSLEVRSAQLDGQLQVAGGARLALDNAALGSHSSFGGAGTMVWQNYITLMGAVEVGAGAPELWLNNTAISSEGLTLTTRNTVHGTQQILLNGTVWNNLGTFSVGPGSEAAIALQGSGAFRNQAGGTVHINQGVLDAVFDEAHANNGAIVLEAGGQLRTGGTDIQNNGSISGTGTLAMGGASGGTLFNNGTVAPGTDAATGTLTVQGNYQQGANGVLDMKLGGMAPGEFDLLDVDGSARLGGQLRIRALGAFAPANAGEADLIVARGGSSGAFDQVEVPALSTAASVTTLSVSYPVQGTGAARVTATVVPTLSACMVNPSTAGCASVLPSLSACTSTPTLAGCSAVLPTLAACTVSPTLQGCSAVLPPTQTAQPAPVPSADICTIAPNSALCQVLSPPTASEPVKPVQQATNQVINTIAAMQTAAPVSAQPQVFVDASANSGSPAADAKTDKRADDKSALAADKAEAKLDAPSKKMYCN